MQQTPTAILADAPGDSSGFQRLGYLTLICYLFLIYSRIFDVKFSFLHIPGISYRIFLMMMFLSRGFVPAMKHSIGKGMYFLTACFIMSVPFSIWRGGSMEYLVNAWLPAFAIFLSTSGMLANFEQVRKAIFTVGYGLCVLSFIALIFGSTEESGRLFLPNGKFSNPNEMAQALCMGLPLWFAMVQEWKSGLKKLAGAGVVFLMLLMISKCGSRGAMITMVVLVLMMFIRASAMGKMKLLMAGIVLFGIIVTFLPGRLLRRYQTMNTDDSEQGMVVSGDDYDAQMNESAVTSAQKRRDLLKRSIKYTFQHPLFGVGPGNFPVAEDADMRAQGFRKGTWQGTHNSYTQVSSEVGMPAALAYMFVIFMSYWRTMKLYKRTKDDPRLSSIANCSLGINYCMLVYAVSVFFDYIAYTSMLSVFGGLAMALDINAQAEIDRLTAKPAEAPPIPFAQFRASLRQRTMGVPQQA
jgi:O-antigen ligase